MKLLIANFSYNLTRDNSCYVLRIFGEIMGCKMVKYPETCKSKGYSLVEFAEDARTKMAIKQIHHVWIRGRQTTVTLAIESTTVHLQKYPRLKHTD